MFFDYYHRLLAGNHGVGLCGDGGPAVDACVAQPSALAFNGGSLYVQTPGYLRKISLGATPVISSVAGPLPQRSCTDGFAAGSCFNVFSGGLAFGPLGELYILDYGNYTVNKITNLQ